MLFHLILAALLAPVGGHGGNNGGMIHHPYTHVITTHGPRHGTGPSHPYHH